MNETSETPKQRMLNKYIEVLREKGEVSYLVVAIKMPSGAITITTSTLDIDYRMGEYETAYDDNLRLHHNLSIQIIDFLLV
jgi:hypothetical protein